MKPQPYNKRFYNIGCTLITILAVYMPRRHGARAYVAFSHSVIIHTVLLRMKLNLELHIS